MGVARLPIRHSAGALRGNGSNVRMAVSSRHSVDFATFSYGVSAYFSDEMGVTVRSPHKYGFKIFALIVQ